MTPSNVEAGSGAGTGQPRAPGEIDLAGKRYLTPEGLAAKLNKSVRTLARWHEDRKGPPRITIGKMVLYPLDKLPGWLDRHTREPARLRRQA